MEQQSTPLVIDAEPPAETPSGVQLRKGAILGRYLLGDTLARGSFGTVWSAEDIGTGRRVAIKFLHPFLSESAEAIARLKREAEAIASITHPNVVEVFEFSRLTDGRPYIVMELLEGINLYTRIRREGVFSPQKALAVLEDICAALTATHALGIIHRDIKASNAFIVDGDPERTVLLDYGLAKILEHDGPELTSSRATLGTPSAMSPEQIRSEPVTPRSDVYALGALAYHLLTGEPAFNSASRPTILYMHLHSKRPRPSRRVDVSPAFDAVISRAMARDPEKRHQTAMAFLGDFAAAVRREQHVPSGPKVPPLPVLGSARMLGVYVDVDAPAELLADPSDALLDDIEAITEIAQPILHAAKFEVSARRGNSALFVKVVGKNKERAERRRLLRLLAVIRSAIDSRPDRVEDVTVRIAVDVVCGGVGDSRAEQQLLEAATCVKATPKGRGTLGTERFFAELGLATEQVLESHDFLCVANNSEL